MKVTKILLAGLLALSLPALAPAASKAKAKVATKPKTEAKAAAQRKVLSTFAVVREIREHGKVVVFKHQDFPGLMKGMTMPFTLESAKLSKGLKVGDAVRFSLKPAGDWYKVSKIVRLKGKAAAKVKAWADGRVTAKKGGQMGAKATKGGN